MVSMISAPGGMELFTPGGSMRWGNCEFRFNAPDGAAGDFWIIHSGVRYREHAQVARINTLFMAAEPPAKKIYPHGFYRQFGHIVDSHAGSRHPRLHLDMLGLPWLVGLSWKQGRFTLGYDAFKALARPDKLNRVSVVCSTTAQTAGQKRRLKFLRALKEQLGDDLVVFGKGFQLVDDKLEGILPYRFHLVLENSQSPHYWTEKLADAYLGWAYPFYVGCPNVGDYFAPESYTPLNLDDVPGAVQTVRAALARPDDPQITAAVRTARDRMLDHYNTFARYAYWAERLYQPGVPETVALQWEKSFRLVRGWYYRRRVRHHVNAP
jgi:hypothetical protein